MAQWLSELGVENETLLTNATVNKYTDLESALNGLVEANARIHRSVLVPSEDASEEDKQAFRKRMLDAKAGLVPKPDDAEIMRWLGAPEKAEDYKLPDEVKFDDEALAKRLPEIAHQLEMTPKQYKAFAALMAQDQAAIVERQRAAGDEVEQKLVEVLGAAKAQTPELVDALIEQFGDSRIPVEHVPAGLQVVLTRMAKAVKQDPQAFKMPKTQGEGKTPEEALARTGEINRKLTSGEIRRGDPQYNALLKEKTALLKQAYPSG